MLVPLCTLMELSLTFLTMKSWLVRQNQHLALSFTLVMTSQ